MAGQPVTSNIPFVTRKEAIAAGSTRYFTGKPCSKGHVDYRNTCDHACCACSREKSARMRKSDPSIAKRGQAARVERYRKDAEFRQARIKDAADWREKNKDRSKAYQAEYHLKNKEERNAYAKKRWAEKMLDPEWAEKERIRGRNRHKANPEAKRCHVRTRRARIRNAQGKHTHQDISSILEKQSHRCAYCKSSLKGGYDVDHITPLSRGGSNWPSNLQCLCADCNGKKWCKDPIDFAREIGRLI